METQDGGRRGAGAVTLPDAEFVTRLERVRQALRGAGLEALLHLPTPTESDAVSESTTDEPSLDNELNTQWDASSIDTGTPVDSVEPVMVVD